MKTLIFIAFLFIGNTLFGQNKRPEDYGFRHLQTIYKGDTVDILIKSKKGDEQKPKPLFLFCQGSLPQPLIKYDEQGMYGVFPFNPDSLTIGYHLAIVSKPYTPVIADKQSLGEDFTYVDSGGKFSKKYLERNLLDYYVNRNIHVIKFLQNKSWISKDNLVVAGHSEGSTIAAKLALSFPQVTQLIYSGGNPLGRILSIIERQRADETDTTKYAEDGIKNWENIVADPTNMDASNGDTYKATYEFSIPPIQYLQKLKIPVLICYGTKDYSSPFNDYLRIEMIRQKRKNFTFKAYIGTDHNYFPLKANGETNYDIFNWDKVANDWKEWIMRP
jgi:dienelactone hydrolase